MILATYQYAAPEYFLGQQGTEKSDLYSLGLVAYELLTGTLPYLDGVASATTPKAQKALYYISTSVLSPSVPEWMDLTIRKAVSIDPAKRYEALSEFIADLRRPNAAFTSRSFTPLVERDPVLF